MEYPGCNGTPPMVYGVSWNPLKPQVGVCVCARACVCARMCVRVQGAMSFCATAQSCEHTHLHSTLEETELA